MNVVAYYETQGSIEITVFLSKVVSRTQHDDQEDSWQAWTWVEWDRFHERKDNGEPIESLVPIVEPIRSDKIHTDIPLEIFELLYFLFSACVCPPISNDFTGS